MSPFSFNPEDMGLEWVGKILRCEEMTALQFDQLRNASLSLQLGEETQIMYLEITRPGTESRGVFFAPDTSPVSKWGRFLSELDDLGVRVHSGEELVGRWFKWREGQVNMGKHGKRQVLSVIGIPSPDEVPAGEASEGDTAPQQPTSQPAPSQAEAPDGGLANLILAMADGTLTRKELIDQVGVDGTTQTSIGLELNKMLVNGQVKVVAGKIVAA